MRVYLTNINGMAGTAQVGQSMVMDVASQLGYRELGIYCYNMEADSDSELNKRLDGVFAGLQGGDIVIFQTPTWNTTKFDVKVMNHLKRFNVKIAVFIHDVIPLMFRGNEYLMPYTIGYYNMADLIIAPSQAMLDVLYANGLTVKKTVIQTMWDSPTSVPQLPATFKKELHFPGSPERFPFIKDWAYETPVHLYARETQEFPEKVHPHGYLPNEALMMELSKGGFGLVWMADHDKEYAELYCPYKLGTFVAAGIPVILQRGIANQEFFEKNKLGVVVDTLEEATEVVQSMDQATYEQQVKQVRQFSPLVRQGYFTRKLLTDTVFKILCE
ncbi:TPA: sugar transferase [Streptococcus agalactiae]